MIRPSKLLRSGSNGSGKKCLSLRKMSNDLLHDIDKRLAVLAALSEEHAKDTHDRFEELQDELNHVRTELSRLRIRVAAIAGTVSLIVGMVVKWVSVF